MTSNLVPLKKTEGPKYRQITTHLRNLINKGTLEPGMRLPTDKQLAKLWGTNHFTVHRAFTPLVTEGLVERVQRKGTFVRDRSQHIASVAVYYGGNVWSPENFFYQSLHLNIEELCQKENRRCFHFIDTRESRDKDTPLPALQEAIDDGKIQGIIGLMISTQEGWLRRLHLPVSLFSPSGVQPSRLEFLELILSRFAADGCRTVGMICPRFNHEWQILFKHVANGHGLRLDSAWGAGGAMGSDRSFEFSGYRLFKERWAGRSHPDGLFVYPDVICRGVTMAALELGVSVPRDLQVIFHRNTGLDYLCPWKIPYFVVDGNEVAQLLIDYVDSQHRNETTPPPTVSSKLIVS